jgi:P27 family predicted phage terminase small subunit
MSIPGPKPKPPALKALEGAPLDEPTLKPPPQAPTCPGWLDAEAKRQYRRLVRELDKLGIVGAIDQHLLVVWAEAVVHHRRACEAIDRDGVIVEGHRGVKTKHPAMQIKRDNAVIIARVAAEFGCSPSSRTRLALPEVDDELERILS